MGWGDISNFERLDKVDKILLSSGDLKRLDEWWLNIHDGAFNEFRPVIEEGVILLEMHPNMAFDQSFIDANNLTSLSFLLYFKQLDDVRVYYEIYQFTGEDQIKYILKATKNYRELKSELNIYSDNKLIQKTENAIRFLDTITTSHIALMNYMELYRDVKERVSYESKRKKVTKRRKKRKKNTRSITIKVYNVNIPPVPVSEKEKKAYRRMKESWTVRGHWRTLPSGRKTWVRNHVKGNKKKLEPNTYHF